MVLFICIKNQVPEFLKVPKPKEFFVKSNLSETRYKHIYYPLKRSTAKGNLFGRNIVYAYINL